MNGTPIPLAAVCMLAHASAAAAQCTIDQDALHSWSDFGTLESARPAPYSVTYAGCDKTLVYVAAEHTNDPASDTFSLVSEAFETRDFDLVVVEGFSSALGESPGVLAEYAAAAEKTPADAEPYFTIRTAVANDVAFMGAEPKTSELVDALIREGVMPAEVFAFQILQNIAQWQRAGQIESHTDPALEDRITEYADVFLQETGFSRKAIVPHNMLEGFKDWYRTTNGQDFDAGFRPEDAWPSGAVPDPKPSNALGDLISDARESHILSVIARASEQHDSVLVVYGASHHLIQQASIEAGFEATED